MVSRAQASCLSPSAARLVQRDTMKILLLDIYRKGVNYRISKDTHGSYGTGNDYGDRLFTWFLKVISKRTNFWPPMYLMYIGSILKKQGHAVEYATELVSEAAYDAIIMSSSIVCHESELEAIGRAEHRQRIIVTGSFVTYNPEHYVALGTKVILGEPEFYFLDNAIEGVLSSSEQTFRVPGTDHDLDRLPIPCWELVLGELAFSGSLFRRTCIPIISSRGCPYTCFSYCTYPLEQGRRTRARSAESVIAEMRFWSSEYGVTEFVFRDPVFGIDRAKTLDLAQRLARSDLRVKFTIETHLNLLDEELVTRLKEAGLFFVCTGIEAASTDVMRAAKRFTLDNREVVEKIAMLRRLEIKVLGMYILGYESDTRDTVLATLEFAKELNLDLVFFSLFTPYPGTPVFERFSDRLLTSRYEDFDMWTPVFRHDHLSPQELRGLLDLAFSGYYLRPKWLGQYLKDFARSLWPSVRAR